MNNAKLKLRQLFPTVIAAFIAGYFFKWMIKDHTLVDTELTGWIGALSTVAAIAVVFFLGERQIGILLTRERGSDGTDLSARHHSYIK